ncbi:PREDICTED: F-box/kelch-repeat protein At3g23880-like [Fragaria vesca subsp. vesca]|uniref:F-box/kelch-repeat protein At3g23880-like n=1 Tax=Fragaria vesca subsp. vesca TaxID=101020 RepID=UPI0002C2E570|nr:PREDICTED: F-box/kelch-repeat protein At3g23880-like [Fragaria vesca subsp. vesca]
MAYKEHQLVPSDGGVAERPRFICAVQDVIEEILPRLPVKSLLRFRCVCKSWRALISASLFAKKHLGHATVTSRLQILEFGSGEYEPGSNVANLKVASRQLDVPRWCSADVHFVSLAQASTRTIRIVGSCNGLICLQVSRGLFLLWNPCTKKRRCYPNEILHRGVGRFMALVMILPAKITRS